MEISGLQGRASLTSRGVYSRKGVSGSPVLGGSTNTLLARPDSHYTVKFIMWDAGANAVLDRTTGTLTTSTPEARGQQQVETATAAGTITTAGNATVTVTAAGMTGSPKAISVGVSLDDTAAQWAAKVRNALAADADVAALFTVGGLTTSISLTRKENENGVRYANDATMNIALDNGTCAGITTAATSANSVAGGSSTGTQIVDGANGEDFEGNAIALTYPRGILVERLDTGNDDPETSELLLENDGATDGDDLRQTIDGSGAVYYYVTPAGGQAAGNADDLIFTATSGGLGIIAEVHVVGE